VKSGGTSQARSGSTWDATLFEIRWYPSTETSKKERIVSATTRR